MSGSINFLVQEVNSEYLFQPKDVLLSILEEVEGCLHMIDQSPSQVKQAAMIPAVSSLGKQKLLRHTDEEIRLMVTSCLSEVTRISAPKAPNDDHTMKEIFQLLVDSSQGLDDVTGSQFTRRVTILETFAKSDMEIS
jgi:sister-chromatid-cohesion protein PDS5